MNNDDLDKELLAEFNDYDDNGETADDSPIDMTGFVFVSIVWFEGRRVNSKIAWSPDERVYYYKNGYQKIYNADAYTCANKDCLARIFVSLSDGTCFKDHTFEQHKNCDMYDRYKETELFKTMKERCITAPSTATIRNIYEEAVIK